MIMATVTVARRRHCNARCAPEHIFQTQVSLFDLPDNEILRRYRLLGHIILALLYNIKDEIEPSTRRSHAIPGVLKLFSLLQVLASSSFQTPIAGV